MGSSVEGSFPAGPSVIFSSDEQQLSTQQGRGLQVCTLARAGHSSLHLGTPGVALWGLMGTRWGHPTSAPELGWGSVTQGSLRADLLLRGQPWEAAGCFAEQGAQECKGGSSRRIKLPSALPRLQLSTVAQPPSASALHPGRDWSLLQGWRDQIWLQSGLMMGAQLCWSLPCAWPPWH